MGRSFCVTFALGSSRSGPPFFAICIASPGLGALVLELNDQGTAMELDNAVAIALDALEQAAGTHDNLGRVQLTT
jgi:hypothetical protein